MTIEMSRRPYWSEKPTQAPYIKSVAALNYENSFRRPDAQDVNEKVGYEGPMQLCNDNMGSKNDLYKDMYTGPSNNRNGNKKQNCIEKTLNEAMQRRVDMGPGHSMMQRMGWTGGGLGRSGDGITEPITANASYATKTKGLGHSDEVPSVKKPSRISMKRRPRIPKKESARIPKKKPSRISTKRKSSSISTKKSKEAFKTNVLQNLLDFVKNDAEVELVFDPQLCRRERKTIHNLVEEVTSCGQFAAMDFYSNAQMDIVQDIVRCNEYVLRTESAGEFPERKLGIYKEAPDHVYLVVPDDLRADNEKNENEDDQQSKETQEKAKCSDVNAKVADISNPLNVDANKVIETSDETNGSQVEIKRAEDPQNAKRSREESNQERSGNEIENTCNDITEDDVLDKVVDYFVDFSSEDSFTEFRFLGTFNETEYSALVRFFNILRNVDAEEFVAKDKVAEVLNGEFDFNLQDNFNGSTVIYKVKKEEIR